MKKLKKLNHPNIYNYFMLGMIIPENEMNDKLFKELLIYNNLLEEYEEDYKYYQHLISNGSDYSELYEALISNTVSELRLDIQLTMANLDNEVYYLIGAINGLPDNIMNSIFKVNDLNTLMQFKSNISLEYEIHQIFIEHMCEN